MYSEPEQTFEKKATQRKQASVQDNISQRKANNLKGKILEDNRANVTGSANTLTLRQSSPNKTGLPDNLKSGMENLSGMSLDPVNVHYNSSIPAAVQAHAYAQGNEIHRENGGGERLHHKLGHAVQRIQLLMKPATTDGNGKDCGDPELKKDANETTTGTLQLRCKVRAEVSNEPKGTHKTRGIHQLVKKLTVGEAFKKLTKKSSKRLKRRAARSSQVGRNTKGQITKRNKLAVTIEAGQLRVTFHLRSAGMGDLHPKHGGKTASHTEAIWEALWTRHKKVLLTRVNKKLKKRGKQALKDVKKMRVVSIISTNGPCKSSPRDTKQGCSGIPASAMGITADTEAVYVREYSDDAPTEFQSLKDSEAEHGKDADSSDDEMDTDLVRGKNLEDAKAVESMFKK